MMNAKELELKLSDALQREDVLKQQLAESQREFRAADATIENQQMQAEKLAAENAALKFGASCLVSEYLMNKGTDSEFIACITPSKKTIGTGGVWDMWRHIEMVLGKTPATDAFLAEVRAQAKADGVQEYADSFRHSASKIRECHGDTIRVRALLHEASNADEFAAQLRKGVQS